MKNTTTTHDTTHDHDKNVSKFVRITTYPIKPLIISLSIPTITTMLISALYNMADTYFVSGISVQATAAVGVTFSFMSLLQAVGFFFGQGAGNFVSRALGAKNYVGASRMCATGVFLATAIGIVIAVVSFIFAAPLARVLGASDTVLADTMKYLRPLCFGVPFIIASFVLNNLLRFQGSAFFGMIGIASGAVINCGLDFVFIRLLSFGVEGAAYATVCGNVFSTILLLFGCTRGGNIRINLARTHLNRVSIAEITKCGLPSLIRQVFMGLSVVVLNNLATNIGHAAGLGDQVVAAMTIVSRITWIMSAAVLGLGQGFQPVCGFNYGAGKHDRVKEALRFCNIAGTVVIAAISVVLFIFAERVVALFRSDPGILQVGAFTLRAQCVTAALLPWAMMSTFWLQTTGRTTAASVLSLARQGVFLIPALLIMTAVMPPVLGLQLAVPVSDVLTFVATVGVMGRYSKRGR
ncbi:MATE family efflux transporter [Clostridia bacterium]|nr:MATE family efflux transporter [Clostridia bacterium]